MSENTVHFTIKSQGNEIRKIITKQVYESTIKKRESRYNFNIKLNELENLLPQTNQKLTKEQVLTHACNYIKELQSLIGENMEETHQIYQTPPPSEKLDADYFMKNSQYYTIPTVDQVHQNNIFNF
jgi:uncharacterized protein YjaG (DUF416 family)